MSLESQVRVELPVECEKAVLMPAQVAPAPPRPIGLENPAEAKAAEAIFAARQKESETVMGLLGLWAGTALLNDLAAEHFHVPADEVEEEKRKKREKQRLRPEEPTA